MRTQIWAFSSLVSLPITIVASAALKLHQLEGAALIKMQCCSRVQGLPHLQMFAREAEGAAYKAREVLLAAAGACSSALLTEVRHATSSDVSYR